MRPSLALLAAAPVLVVLALGCGSSQQGAGGSGGSGGSDGKVHPPGNGQRESEAAACSALSQAQEMKLFSIGCVGTSPTCPDLLRDETGTACLQYDQGSVAGCVSLYDEQTTCDGLSAAIVSCVPVDFPGSAPNGC